MRSIKKIAALVLAFAMLTTMFAFSASAETQARLYLDGPEKVAEGEVYTVSIRLDDESNLVGGFSGTLTYSGATFEDVQVHPSVLELNDTDDASTVITDKGNGEIDFVTVTRVDGTNTDNPKAAIWFKVKFTVTGDASFALTDVKFSNKAGKALLSATEGTVGAALTPEVVSSQEFYSINDIKIKDTADATKQGLEYQVVFPGKVIPEDAIEYGVVFIPTKLLDGEVLTVNTTNAVVAKVNKTEDPEDFEAFVENGTYYAYLNFAFSSEDKAYQFLGTKISAVAYYKTASGIVYSDNTNGIGVTDGVADRAVLNVAKDKAAAVETNKSSVTPEALAAALADLDGANTYKTNRGTLLQFVADNY
ncbi:MAG: hypothetical protein J6Q56_01735 [Clostridia bacterium]|nr:hypothetical protein [Clostridia bacterium]